MKIKPEHFSQLKALIEPLDTPTLRTRYQEKDFPRSDNVKNLDMRYRWDLLYTIPGCTRRPLMDEMYAYMNDNHIDTALRRIVRPL